MLFQFLQKQKDIKKQKKLIETMIVSLTISPDQKELYLQALEILNQQEANTLFQNLTKFVEKIELKEVEEIRKESFTVISGMKKKEANEKMEELNGLSFLFHNL